MEQTVRNRREIIGSVATLAAAAGIGTMSFAQPGRVADKANAAEQANLKLVNDFCAAWAQHDLANLMSYFSDNPSYRQTERQAPVVGRSAVSDKIGSFLNSVVRFDVHESWARGPVVVNERSDFFTGRMRLWRGVGTFLIKDGKIVEWSDYTMELKMS